MREPHIRRARGASAFLAVLLLAAAAHAEEHPVAARPIEDLKAVFGTVESVKTAPARARIGGTLADLAIVEGERVEAGKKLARVNDPKLALQIAALEAKVRSLEAQRDLADTELKRARELRATGAGSQARLDSAETNLGVVQGQLAAAMAERAVVVQQQSEGDVVAPVSGRVLKVKAINGTVVMPGETIVDVGSGAGLPGLGLAILGSACEVVLIESHQRRAEFSREAAASLGLGNLTVLPRRAEEVGRDPVWREHCRRATARRLADLSILLEYTLPLLAVGGRAIFAKGEKLEEELAAAAGVAEMLGGAPPEVLAVPLPPPSAAGYGAETRRFVVVTKVAPTPDTYPRRPGKPAKQPLRARGAGHA